MYLTIYERYNRFKRLQNDNILISEDNKFQIGFSLKKYQNE